MWDDLMISPFGILVTLHDHLSRRFFIDCDPFFIEDSDAVIVTKGAN